MLGLKQTTLGRIRSLPDNTKVYIISDDFSSELKQRYLYYVGILCNMLNENASDVMSKSRRQELCMIRTMVWVYLRDKDNVSTHRIAKIAKRNYSTIIVLSNNFKEMIEFDKKVKKIYDVFKNYVENEKPLDYVKPYEWEL